MEDLKALALELLAAYEAAARGLISCRGDAEDEESLAIDVVQYRERIERAAGG